MCLNSLNRGLRVSFGLGLVFSGFFCSQIVLAERCSLPELGIGCAGNTFCGVRVGLGNLITFGGFSANMGWLITDTVS